MTDIQPVFEDLDDMLKHFGVRGMHWGVRKAPPLHPSISKRQNQNDQRDFGKGGAARINKRVHAGQTRKDAQGSEARRAALIKVGILGGAFALSLLAKHGDAIESSIITRAERNRGRDAIPAIMSEAAGLKYSKKRGGVYKITTL